MSSHSDAMPARVQDEVLPTASLDEVDITVELDRRPRRAGDFPSEDRALEILADALAKNPRNMLAQLVNVALDRCRADTAGLSLLEGDVFRWEAVAGVCAAYQNGTLPRAASPCGICIDRNITQLMHLPDRCFPALKTEPRFVEALLVPFHRQGRPIGTVWVVSHTTERKFDREDERTIRVLAAFASAGYELWKAYEATEIASQLKDRFLATLGHEMRNPLSAIRSATQVLRFLIGSKDGDAAHALDVQDRQSRLLVRMANDLLDLSRIGHGKIELELHPVDLQTVIDDAVVGVRPAIEGRGQRLLVERPGHPLIVQGDADRLAQVLSNLLGNASKYTPTGGQIWLTVEQPEAHVRMTVRDNGIGIPKEHFGTIFEMFRQLGNPNTSGVGGLGVGLALVRRLTELHGGQVEVMSDGPGQGSRFVVILPVASARQGSNVRPI
jgi:signal transduction histidine kinase